MKKQLWTYDNSLTWKLSFDANVYFALQKLCIDEDTNRHLKITRNILYKKGVCIQTHFSANLIHPQFLSNIHHKNKKYFVQQNIKINCLIKKMMEKNFFSSLPSRDKLIRFVIFVIQYRIYWQGLNASRKSEFVDLIELSVTLIVTSLRTVLQVARPAWTSSEFPDRHDNDTKSEIRSCKFFHVWLKIEQVLICDGEFRLVIYW